MIFGGIDYEISSKNRLGKNSNGRLYAMAASILKKIKLKLICERTTEGSVKLAGQEFNSNRALIKMANIMHSRNLDGNIILCYHTKMTSRTGLET